MEADQSISVNAYYKGFSVLITKRNEKTKIEPLLRQSVNMIEWLIDNGFEPSWNAQTNAQYKK